MNPDRWRGMLVGTTLLGGMVATDWTAMSLAALGVAGTLGGGFLGAWMQQRGLEMQEQQRQRDLAAEVVANAFLVLAESAPEQLEYDDKAELDARLAELRPQHAAVSSQLWTLAI